MSLTWKESMTRPSFCISTAVASRTSSVSALRSRMSASTVNPPTTVRRCPWAMSLIVCLMISSGVSRKRVTALTIDARSLPTLKAITASTSTGIACAETQCRPYWSSPRSTVRDSSESRCARWTIGSTNAPPEVTTL